MSTESHTQLQVNAVAVRLPPFSTQEPVSWFRRAEIQLRLRKITDPQTKADYVLEAIPETLFPQISAWLDQQDDVIQYDDLKAFLLKEYTLSTSDRAKRLLDMPHHPLGDRMPRQIWNEIQSLARLPQVDPATGKNKRIDLMRELWLQTLPPAIRAAIPDSDDLEMDALVTKADSLLNASKASQKPASAAYTGMTVPAQTAGASDEVSGVLLEKLDRSRHIPGRPAARRSFTPFTAILRNGICSYHEKFGASARRCLDGCKWVPVPKNASGGRL